MKYLLLIRAKKWLDKVNGNTYHSVSVRVFDKDGDCIFNGTQGLTYGYSNHYEKTARGILESGDFGLSRKIYGEHDTKKGVFKDVVVWDVSRKKDLKFYPNLWT